MPDRPPNVNVSLGTVAPAEPRRRSRRKDNQRTGAPSAGWWGDGPPPWERWPGVTIKIEAVWVEERRRWESPDGKYFYDRDAADRAVEFFPEFLRHHIGEFAGQPFALLEYQELTLTRPIFGWKKADSGLRRFKSVFAFLPKGAGKSPWGAGTGLYLTLCDDEPAAEVYAVAGDKLQARVVHDNARIMVEESPDLLEMCEVLRDSIYHAESRSTYQVLSSDAPTKHGYRPHGIIFDEIHNQKDRKLFEALTKSLKKRRQPLLIIITHAGEDDEGIAYEEYEYAKRVLSGTVPDDTCLPVIFEATTEEDPHDPAVWARVNPGHGVTVQHDAIAAESEKAKVEPRKLNDFLRFTLNRWVNAASAWILVDQWDKCPTLPTDEKLRELAVFPGLDMSQKYDLTAFPLVFIEYLESDGEAPSVEVIAGEDGVIEKRVISLNFEISIVPFFWIPEATMRERIKSDRVPYGVWAEQGLVRVTEGNVIDYDTILRDITGEIAERFPRLKEAEIGYDPAFATDIATKLSNRGYRCVEILQNYKYMSEPAHLFEALIKGQRVRHSGHRVLRWNVENCAVKRDDAGRIRPVKPRNQAKRIDGVVGALMGLSRAVLGQSQTDDDFRPL